MNSSELVQYIALAVSGWTLLEVIAQGKTIVAIKTKLKMQNEN